ncbi:MAG: peptidase [Frankiales bacterium]|nr:peptidase [Frankiales bacterium]
MTAAQTRLDRARAVLAAEGVDALLLTPGAELRYLTGYDALPLERLTCLVLPVTGDAVLVVPKLERPRAEDSPAARLGIAIVDWPETADPQALVATLLAAALGRPARRVAVADRMWAMQSLALADALGGATLVTAGPLLKQLRMRKDGAELAALRDAAAAIDRVHDRVPEWLRPGRTESEVGRDIAESILAEGHVAVNFVIVACGPNGASPHHETGERLLERGDLVVVDIGGTNAAGYCSDSTRTYALGDPGDEARRMYDALQRAQAASCESVRPGASAESIDAAARDVITAAGYGEFFIHRTGHGIGLDEHEEPYIVSGNTEPVEAGMTFSIEPGIYLPGRFGARIEDIVAVTATGVERLNRSTRDLIVLD